MRKLNTGLQEIKAQKNFQGREKAGFLLEEKDNERPRELDLTLLTGPILSEERESLVLSIRHRNEHSHKSRSGRAKRAVGAAHSCPTLGTSSPIPALFPGLHGSHFYSTMCNHRTQSGCLRALRDFIPSSGLPLPTTGAGVTQCYPHLSLLPSQN